MRTCSLQTPPATGPCAEGPDRLFPHQILSFMGGNSTLRLSLATRNVPPKSCLLFFFFFYKFENENSTQKKIFTSNKKVH